jgi:hypothetical protein
MVGGESVTKIDNSYILITDSDVERCFTTDLGEMCKAYDTQRRTGARFVTLLQLHHWCTLLPEAVLEHLAGDVAGLKQLTAAWSGRRKVQGVVDAKTPDPAAEPHVPAGSAETGQPAYYVALTWVAPFTSAKQLIEQHVTTPDDARDFVATLSRQLHQIYEDTKYLRPIIKIEKLAEEPNTGSPHLVLGDLGFDNFLDLPDRGPADQQEDVRLLAELLTQLLDGLGYKSTGPIPFALSLAALRTEPHDVRNAWPWELPPVFDSTQKDLWVLLTDRSIRTFTEFADELEHCRLPVLATTPAVKGKSSAPQPEEPDPSPPAPEANAIPPDKPGVPAVRVWRNGAAAAGAAKQSDRLLIRIMEGTAEYVIEQLLQDDAIVMLGDGQLNYVAYPGSVAQEVRFLDSKLADTVASLKRRRIYVQHHRGKIGDTGYYTVTDFDPPRGAPPALLNGLPLSPLFAALLTKKSVIEVEKRFHITLDVQKQTQPRGWVAAQEQGAAIPLVVDAPGGRVSVDAQLDSALIPLKVHNLTDRVERLNIFVDGAPVDWPVSNLLIVPLYENESAQPQFVLKLLPERLADEYSLIVRLISDNIGAQVAADRLRLSVPPVVDFSAALQPETLRAGKYGELHVYNAGNFGRQFVVTWRDRANELLFDPPQTIVGLPAYSSGAVNFRADVARRARPWFGRDKNYEISVTVAPLQKTQGAPKTVSGQVVGSAKIAAWLLPLVFLLLATMFIFYTLLFPPRFSTHLVEVNGTPMQVPVEGERLVLHWDADHACLHTVSQNGVEISAPQLDFWSEKTWDVANPRAGDELTVQLRGCSLVRTEEWTVNVAAVPPTPAMAPVLQGSPVLGLHTQNVVVTGPATNESGMPPLPDHQLLLLAGQTGDLCIQWDVQETYSQDAYALRLITQPPIAAIDQQAQLDQPSGEKCFPISTTFTDAVTNSAEPNNYFIRVGAVNKATGMLESQSTETKVVQLFKPVCRANASEYVWIREGPGEEYPQRGVLTGESGEVFPLSSPVQLQNNGMAGEWWVPITVANDPRPGWVKEGNLACPVPITVLPASGQVPPTPTPTPSPSPTATPLPTATPTPPPEPKFAVSPKIITVGDCAMLTWSIQNIDALYLNGEGVAGEAEREVCPGDNGQFFYTWTIINKDGSTMERSVTLTVNDD